jgi:hypothetical protein
MTTFYVSTVGTIFFLVLTIFSFFNKRFGLFVSNWKYPLFVFPLIAFLYILSTQLYIPFKGNGCSYAERQDFIQPDNFSPDKESGILLLFINGFGNCRVTVTMDNKKVYSGESFNNIFAIVLPSDSGKVDEILMSDKVSRIPGKMRFVINPGKLTYIGSINNSKGLLGLLMPGVACKSADVTYDTFSDSLSTILTSWAHFNRLILTSSIKKQLSELRNNYIAASQFAGLQFGYLPFISTSINGKVQTMAPDEVIKQYKKYEFLVNNH